MDEYESLADAMNRAAISKGWNGRKLAEKLDVAPSTAYRWLQGKSEPEIDLWPKIESVLGLPEGTFFSIRQRNALETYELQRALAPAFKAMDWQANLNSAINPLSALSNLFDQGKSLIGVDGLANKIGTTPTQIEEWAKGFSFPPPVFDRRIEHTFGLDSGAITELRTKQRVNPVPTINPDQIAAHGDLKDEDRPDMARLLEQILENQAELKQQQAKIIEHLNLNEDEP